MRTLHTVLLWSLLALILVCCGDQSTTLSHTPQESTAVISAYSYEPREYWIGTAPFCNASPHECATLAMDFVREDSSGDGKTCWTGKKVLCRDRRLTRPAPVEEQADAFSILTYNVFMRPAIAGQDGQLERAEHIPSALALLPGGPPDVIAHTELFQDAVKARLSELYGPFGLRYVSRTVLDAPGTAINGGVVLYSRWPIVKEAHQVFTRGPLLEGCAGADCLAAKGVVYIAVEKTVGEHSQRVHVFASHLQAWNTPQGQAIRHKQLKEIKQLQARMKIPEDEPVFFVGDFNIDAQHDAAEYQAAVATLHAEPQAFAADFFSSDPQQLPLVGRDGAAASGGCAAHYQQHHYCPCCPRELLDYVLHDRSHLQPRETPLLQVVRPRAAREFAICVNTAVPMPGNQSAHSQWCRESWRISDLSDHLAVLVRYIF
jgi:endonuclease/exonuclease/phosphatase family metal-dependent hydrolase